MSESGSDFDTIIDRSNTSSEKWDRYRGHDIIPLWVADMDFRTAPAIIEALHERVSHGIFGYTSPPQKLVATVLDMLNLEYGWLAEPEWIVWLPGLVTGLNVACRAIGDNSDEVLTFTPIYPPFMSAPHLSQRTLIKVPLQLKNGRWVWDRADLEQAITPRTRLLLFCNPHNPVGRVWARDELIQLVEVAEQHNLIICSDEIHAGLVLDKDKQHIPIATLSAETARRTITLLAPSKTFNIPGLGCSFAVISDHTLRRAFRKAIRGIVPQVNTLGYTAAQAAYNKGGKWRRELISYLRRNRDLVTEEVNRMPGLSMAHVEATYLAWIDARQTGIEQPVQFFEDAGVGVSDGADFDAPGFIRLNFGCPQSLLIEGLGRMRNALAARHIPG